MRRYDTRGGVDGKRTAISACIATDIQICGYPIIRLLYLPAHLLTRELSTSVKTPPSEMGGSPRGQSTGAVGLKQITCHSSRKLPLGSRDADASKAVL